MTKHVLAELLLPFVGTALGAGCVFFLKKGLDLMVRRALTVCFLVKVRFARPFGEPSVPAGTWPGFDLLQCL